MKKMFALMLAAMMLLAMMPTAMAAGGDDTSTTPTLESAYTPVTPGNKEGQIDLVAKHTMYITESEWTNLPNNFTVNFALSDFTVVQPTNVTNPSMLTEGSGSVTIDSITYESTEEFTGTNKSKSTDLKVNWNDFKIKEPGVYRWKITKNLVTEAPDADKDDKIFYLFVYAIVDGSGLKIEAINTTADAQLTANVNKGEFEDSYPVKNVDLAITKTVEGNQASKDQYFSFTVNLKSPSGTLAQTLAITDAQGNPLQTAPQTAYNNQQSNPTSVTVDSNGAQITLWLKAGQTAVINNLLYNSYYNITEGNNAGYDVANKIEETGSTTTAEFVKGSTATDNYMTGDTTVTFKNTKEATVPTGITLNTAAPVAGMMLALAMIALLFVGKRKEEMA